MLFWLKIMKKTPQTFTDEQLEKRELVEIVWNYLRDCSFRIMFGDPVT